MKEENKKIKSNEEQEPEEQMNLEETADKQISQEEEVDTKDLRIAELEKEVAELKDKFLRKVAEFENYKRRTENDQLSLIKYSSAALIVKLLPVIDDFERSLEHIEEARDSEALKEGLKLIYGKLKKVLDDEGVKKIDSIGKPFDVEFHEAIMQKPDDTVEPLTVIDEIEKGYLYKDKVIRHSKVIVSEEPSEQPADKNNKNTENEG